MSYTYSYSLCMITTAVITLILMDLYHPRCSAKQTVSVAVLLLLLVVSEDAVEQPPEGNGGGVD